MPKFSIFTKIILIVFFALILPLILSNYFIISIYQGFINKYVSGIESESIKATLEPFQKSAYLQNIVVLVLFLFIVFVVFLVLSKIVLKPIKKLAEGTKEVANGNFNTKVSLKTGDELEVLAESFNQMVEKLKEAFLKAGEEQQKTMGIIMNFIDCIFVFDNKKILTVINPQAEKIFGISDPKRVIGKKIWDLEGDYRFSVIVDLIKQDSIEKVSKKIITFKKDKEGKTEEFFFESSTVPLRYDSKGEIFGYIVILHDITREKSIERIKSEFISLAAHQLLTPTSVVKWTLDAVLNGETGRVSKKQKDSLRGAVQNNERTIAVVDDLLNVARIEEGRFVGEFTEEILGDLVKSTIDDYQKKIKEKNIEVNVVLPKDPIIVNVNRQSLMLAMNNLLNNALEYNVIGGKVTIRAGCDNMKVKVEFEDTGIGILNSEHGKIFTKFFRGDNAFKIKSSGTGLGLFIVKSVIEAHRGEIGFSSQENKGSVFWFTLPLERD